VPDLAAGRDLGTVAWVDGSVVVPGEPAIRPEDRGLAGVGVFEAIKVVDGVPFALRRHLDRLAASAAPLGLPVDLDRVREAVAGVLATGAAAHSPSWLRITVTGGPAPMTKGAEGTGPTVIAAVAPMAPWPEPARVVVLPWCRNDRGAVTGLKTISYVENAMAVRYALDHDADEGIFANTRGDLCEGAGTNIFVVQDGVIVTPPLRSGCLAGVTRDLLLEWCPGIVETELPIGVLETCEEAFLTSTSRDVHPIGAIDGRPLARVPGDHTREAMACFAARVARDRDP
jgi:branched-chain amino acid aminotransferase